MIPASALFERAAHGAKFRDRIAIRVEAPPDVVFQALMEVSLRDMPLAWFLGEIRYLPSRLAGRAPAADSRRPFLDVLKENGTLILHNAAPRELLTGSAGKLHQWHQEPVRFENRAAFDAFSDGEYEKLFISVRVEATHEPGIWWLVLEHATLALSAEAERRFKRYWRVIKPAGAFVSRQLLKAVRARAIDRMARGAMTDPLLDRFMPSYDYRERHHIVVAAPPALTMAAAEEQELFEIPLVRAIFRAREWILGATPDTSVRPKGLVAQTLSMGWVVLAEDVEREVVVGAVTKPWEPNVVFRSIEPERFAAFNEGGYVKIVWTLRAEPAGSGQTVFSTETRVVSTDDEARSRFKRYWLAFSPGIRLIRTLSLGPLKRDAERRARDRASRVSVRDAA